MREMKDSGIPWIGEIPSHWRVTKIKYLFDVVSGGTPSSSTENWDGDVIWVTPADYKTKDRFVSQGKRNLSRIGYQSCSASLVPEGSIIFSKRAPIGAVAMSSVELCTNQGCLSCVKKTKNLTDFFYYVMSINTEQFELLGTGTTFKEISAASFADFRMPYPPLAEQSIIADFLDRKCGEVDAVAAEIEKQIESLEDYKRSAITEAVTKGLNPAAEMKPSGVEWIGEIPKEWNVGKVSFFYDVTLGKMIQPEQLLDSDTYEYYLCAANLGQNKLKLDDLKQMWVNQQEKENLQLKKGDLVVVEGGDVASCDIIPFDLDKIYFQNSILRVRGKNKNDSRILRYVLMSAKSCGHIDLICNKATIAHFTKEKLLSLQMPMIPISEQRAISDFLDDRCAEIDGIVADKKSQLEVLADYKKSLIYEYVTGKKEVPCA